MRIKIKLFANFREITKSKDVSIDVEDGTIRDVVSSLIAAYPGLGPLIMTDHEIKPYVNILLNGKSMNSKEGLLSKVKEGDEIALFPPVSGG